MAVITDSPLGARAPLGTPKNSGYRDPTAVCYGRATKLKFGVVVFSSTFARRLS